MKKYCMKCGSPTDFSIVKPKFCSNCGNSFETGLVASVDSVAKKNNIKINKSLSNIQNDIDIDFEEDQIDDIKNVPNISEINCDYEVNKHKGVKFKSVINNPIPPSKNKSERPKGKKMSKKDMQEFLDNFKKESGSIRPKK